MLKYKYTDYCTTFYYSEEQEVWFWDELNNKRLGRAVAEDKESAHIIMLDYVRNAPSGVICEMI